MGGGGRVVYHAVGPRPFLDRTWGRHRVQTPFDRFDRPHRRIAPLPRGVAALPRRLRSHLRSQAAGEVGTERQASVANGEQKGPLQSDFPHPATPDRLDLGFQSEFRSRRGSWGSSDGFRRQGRGADSFGFGSFEGAGAHPESFS